MDNFTKELYTDYSISNPYHTYLKSKTYNRDKQIAHKRARKNIKEKLRRYYEYSRR